MPNTSPLQVEDFARAAKTPVPTLPPERYDAVAYLMPAYECGDQILAYRNRGDHDDADVVRIDAHHHQSRIVVNLTLTPAMIVHLANEMLTDAERCYITAPSLKAAWAYMGERERAEILAPAVAGVTP